METFKILKTLSETEAPSGREDKIAPIIAELWEPLTDSFSTDRLGNAIALKRGNGPEPRPRLLLAAHMDEIGLMVSQIVEHNGQGFLRLTNVGGVDRRQVYAQLVTVHGKKDLPGVIGCLPGHLLPEERRDKPFDYEDLLVDMGLPLVEVEANVSIGDFISFRQPLRKLLNKRVSGKALDNRASVAAVTICLEYLNGRSHHWDVLAVATVQEETRLLGAYTSGHSQRPDAAIAIDVTFGKGPATNDEGSFELGSGPTIDLGPNVHPGMFQALQDTAEALEMSVSTSTHTRGSGTDAFGLQIARDGIPTGLVSIPLRYMHTMVESVDMKDVERAGRLLGEFIVRLDGEFKQKLSDGLMESEAKD